jgi:uncharacterized protein (TIGR02265 family)
MSTVIGPRDVLEGDIAAEVRGAVVPDSYVVKGMFFSRLKEKLEDCWGDVTPLLLRPPRFGHYVPFTDYPQRDYLTLSILIAERVYSYVPPREGLRRLARDDFGVFSASTFGRIVLTAVGDVHNALLTMAAVYSKMAAGDWEVRGTELDRSTVVLEWFPTYGSWEYQLGQIEGLIFHYGVDYEIHVSTPRADHFRFEVRHR